MPSSLNRINYSELSFSPRLLRNADQSCFPLTVDFVHEILSSLRFFVDYTQGKPHTRRQQKATFGEAFGVGSARNAPHPLKFVSPNRGDTQSASRPHTSRPSQDERVPLAP
jgi:hypothetical protein